MGGGEGRGKRRRREGEETKREGKKGEKENLIFCRELWFLELIFIGNVRMFARYF